MASIEQNLIRKLKFARYSLTKEEVEYLVKLVKKDKE